MAIAKVASPHKTGKNVNIKQYNSSQRSGIIENITAPKTQNQGGAILK